MLPVLFDKDVLREHKVNTEYKYDESTDASMTQAFSMCYRYLKPTEFFIKKDYAGIKQL
jgi:hypothetical protein